MAFITAQGTEDKESIPQTLKGWGLAPWPQSSSSRSPLLKQQFLLHFELEEMSGCPTKVLLETLCYLLVYGGYGAMSVLPPTQ